MQSFISKEDVWTSAPDHLKGLIDGHPSLRNGFFPLGDGLDPANAGIVMLKMAPGSILERHAHNCYRFETIVTGSLYVEDKILEPGDVMVALPGQFYGPHTAGPDGVTTCEVFGSFMEAYQPTFEAPDGTSHAYNFLEGDIPAEDVWEWNRRNAPVVELG